MNPMKQGVPRGSDGKIKTSYRLAQKKQKAAQEEHNVRAVARLRRLKVIIAALLEDGFLESPCGQMWILEDPVRIDATEYEAASRMHRILINYDRLVLGVNRSVKAQNLAAARGSSVRNEPDPEAVREASAKLMEVEGILGRAGPDVACATKALVRGEDWRRRVGVGILGLRALCKAWGLYDLPEPALKREVRKLRTKSEPAAATAQIAHNVG